MNRQLQVKDQQTNLMDAGKKGQRAYWIGRRKVESDAKFPDAILVLFCTSASCLNATWPHLAVPLREALQPIYFGES